MPKDIFPHFLANLGGFGFSENKNAQNYLTAIETMAQNYDPQRDGIETLQGRKVYHVVQQVAHAKPVAQHQPIFYGKK